MSEKAILLPLQSEGICSTAHNPSATLFCKKPPGSEPHRKQHVQARASANTDLDLSPWKRLWVTSKFTSPPSTQEQPPTLLPVLPDPGLKRATSLATPPDQHFSHPSQSCKALLPQVCSPKHAKEVNRPSCSPAWNQPQGSQCPSLLLQSPTRTWMLSSPFTFSFNL